MDCVYPFQREREREEMGEKSSRGRAAPCSIQIDSSESLYFQILHVGGGGGLQKGEKINEATCYLFPLKEKSYSGDGKKNYTNLCREIV